MRIQKIEVNGFKSFADRDVVHLDDHVTAVIGPNGCGKSNIVDAIRWCLGEQRPKHLRGSGMADVIFAGSSTRGPAGMAEVTITFENEGDFQAPYTNYAEIAVSRRLFRDGTSEYLINKVPCRLKDISEMLMGTGVGTRGYSVIEQGRVGQIVTSKPETRRNIIDEAAGITKFKAQKATAERKIDQTRQNLLRVTDVITELEGRLSSLRRQAQKAERYKRYRKELRDLELWSAVHKFLELEMTGRVLEARHGELSAEVTGLRNESSACEARIEAQRLELSQLEKRFSEAQQRSFGLENRISILEQEKRFAAQEREGLEQSVSQAKAEVDVVGRSLSSLEGDLSGVVSQQETLGAGEGEDSEVAAAERLAGEYDSLTDQLRDEQAALERARGERAKLETTVAGLEAHIHSRVEGLDELESRLTTLGKDLAAERAVESAGREELDGANAALAACEAELVELRKNRAALDAERATLRDRMGSAEVEVETARKELLRARSRLQSLQEIQSRYRSCASGVQVVMEHRERLAQAQPSAGGPVAVHGIMADFISAPAHLEPAVSAVLGDRLQGVVVDAPQVGAGGVELLKELQEGRTTFLPRQCREPVPDSEGMRAKSGKVVGWSDPGSSGSSSIEVVDAKAGSNLEGDGVLGTLSDLVEVQPNMKPLAEVLLGDTVVVDKLPRALELWQKASPGQTLVTLEGDRVEPSGVVVGGSTDALDSALLQQKREIKELEDIAKSLEEEFKIVKARQQGVAERQAEVEQQREQSESDVLAAEKAKLGAAQDVEGSEQQIQRSTRLVESLDASKRTAESALAERKAERERMQSELEDARARKPQVDDSLEASQKRIIELTVDRERAAERLTEAKVALARWQQQKDALEATRERLEKQVSGERDRIERLSKTASEGANRIDELQNAMGNFADEHDQKLKEHKDVTEEKSEAKAAYDGAKVDVDELEVAVRNLRKELDAQREKLNEVELGLKELELERKHLENDLSERFEVNLREILADFHHRPLVGKTEADRSKELKRILSRMGEVNLTAITEFEQVSERYEYLTRQSTDLESAIEQLQAAIDRINKTTRERFRETFEQVNETFQKVFPRLFSGGRAELVMTDPSDLLGTGVDIFAQPPGKKIASLELLSGGEKALTAVSLIFAIFLIKPSPFCLLDEVDAPLDEANVGRFCGLVRQLAENTQFILITHNKRTMELADRLYGVTMQQRGVSKLVSVNLRRAVDEAQFS
jgi:chromosome segregation protein